MNKADITIVVLLFLLLMAWGYSARTTTPPPKAVPVPSAGADTPGLAAGGGATNAPPDRLPADTVLKMHAPQPTNAALTGAVGDQVPPPSEETVVLSNDLVNLVFSSRSGGIASIQLKKFRSTLDAQSPPTLLDFSTRHALAFDGLPGMSTNGGFLVERFGKDNALLVERQTAEGLVLKRTVELADGYWLKIVDVFSNSSAQTVSVSAHGLSLGPMQVTDVMNKTRDAAFLGLDSLAAHGGEGVQYWLQSGVFSKSPVLSLFSDHKLPGGELPPFVAQRADTPVLWVAAKSKFFVQILDAGENTAGCAMEVWRDPANAKNVLVDRVSATILFPKYDLEPGGAVAWQATYYAGPKKYALLKQLGPYKAEVMQFGRWFGWICKMLLPVLNGIYAVIPNYGIAIIVLTILVRIVFWPLTHKSSESMKKMQQIQPLVSQLREKYKDKPQKLQQETMALYKEHKVNPMAGCLPMLVQIPVFIALFTVLQSAIELRFAGFLWIKDLSEPEGLFAEAMRNWPLVKSLNILPLIMTAMTIWQQKLTPAVGDPQQQKIMMFMPVFMLFLFYSMASALVLYWTVSQILAIVQMVQQQRKGAREGLLAAPSPAAAPAPQSRRRGK